MSDSKRGRGRPKWKPNYEEVEKLYAQMCTDQDIADWFGVSRKTVERHNQNDEKFQSAKTKGMAHAKISIRGEQFKVAKKGNVSMLIWLGKQYLGQKEKQEVDHQSSDGSMTPTEIRRIIVDPETIEELENQ